MRWNAGSTAYDLAGREVHTEKHEQLHRSGVHMWSPVDPRTEYERLARKNGQRSKAPSCQIDRGPKDQHRSTLCEKSEFEYVLDEEGLSDLIDDENSEWLDTTLNWDKPEGSLRVPESCDSVLPSEFRMAKDLPGFFDNNWKPYFGYPVRILEYALQFSTCKTVRKAVALLDCFLYYNLIGRIPRESLRGHMQWKTWCELVDKKIRDGQWQLVAPFKRFRNPDGKPDGIANVYALTPAYAMACYESELTGGRYSSFTSMENRKRLNPKVLRTTVSATIDDDQMHEFDVGTGISANPASLMEVILNPQRFRMEGYSDQQVWRRAVRGWRSLTPYMFEKNIRPSWTLGKNGWYYTSKPNLQHLSKIVRMSSLRGLDGERIVELDLSGCQMNIARAMSGRGVLRDPYEEMLAALAGKNLKLDRKTVKHHALSAFCGRSVANYDYYVRQGKETDPRECFIAVRDTVVELGYLVNDVRHRRAQGRIMLEAMRYMVKHTGYTGLTVFDSLIAPEPTVEIAEEALKESCYRELGVLLPFTKNSIHDSSPVSGFKKNSSFGAPMLLQA